MTNLAINTDLLALSIIFITFLAIHLYFKIRSMRTVIKALFLQVDNAHDENIKLKVQLQRLKLQNEILKEAK